MGQRTFGTLSLTFPDAATPSERAGTLSTKDQQQTLKAREGVSATAVSTAVVLKGYPDRFLIKGVTAEGLESEGQAVEAIDEVVTNLETALLTFKQERLLRAAQVHEDLLRVNRYVSSQELDDPTLRQLIPDLNGYVNRD